MGIFSRFENKMEDAIDGLGDKFFDSPISPVQIAKRAEKQMKRNKMLGAGKQYAPTLYTILVNPNDDSRLFGYYPTLAGETETYLKAKANEFGFIMDGDPLVRFIVDDDLKSGKFDVIAEAVAGDIVLQLRAEENQRYASGASKRSSQIPNSNNMSASAPASQPNANISSSQPKVSSPFADNSAEKSNPQSVGENANNIPDAVSVPEVPNIPSVPNPAPVEPSIPEVNQAPANVSIPEVNQAPANVPIPEVNPAPVNVPVPEPTPAPVNVPVPEPTPIPNVAPAQADNNFAQPQTPAAQTPGPQSGPQPNPAVNPSAKTAVFTGGFDVPGQPNSNIAVPNVSLFEALTGKSYPITTAITVIGRDTSCNVVVSDVNASRQHAQITYSSGIWVISDLGSTNGTYVNNQEISSRELRHGDLITVGVTKLTFNMQSV